MVAKEVYGLKRDIAERASAFFTGHGAQRGGSPNDGVISSLQIAITTTDIDAVTNGYMESGTAQLLTWDVTGTPPVALSSTGLGTIEVWSAFEDAIPSGTRVIIGKVPDGYIIIQPLNYCPTSGAGGGGGDPI